MNTLNRSGNNHSEAKGNYSQAVYRDHVSLFNELTEQEIKSAVRKKSSTAAKLARNAPQQHRGEMEKLFNISLFIHHRFEEIHKLPKQDIHGAITIFLYGIWSIYNQGAALPGKRFDTLVTQTRDTMRERAEFLKEYEKSSSGNRSALYETFAMIGNWLLMIQHHLTSQPDETALNNVKIMVREIITRSLKIEPESISISQEGELTITDQNCTTQ
ncbi:MAG: hypothetical protein N0C81_04725 [Candidatus Thiodiazotropha lotti]|uniref:Uncharacterized protein n=1 Tax=Candidatus Thiodiazotropha lotti TaxID=2792787 RepID=A0A9E4K5T2_9GAMM|nr:hypothetical protein [Candidatus Thiodiazotropha lotti]ODC01897.1 hypothetical protein A3197_05465 [Candidatus Thiodiazotropha endoloripes]MCG7923508.1 hypothetical protein [Candidatus Thiodiazotropha lotti]MCG7931874.1 hypothetical protein [Candidatus Thiodiazotropha lotti]MCG7939699.1 hypothetical protein [Candidatus Thiodiazotropha lotti]